MISFVLLSCEEYASIRENYAQNNLQLVQLTFSPAYKACKMSMRINCTLETILLK